ncbi:hypothetical protein [Solwaraspora sp. WMMD792]|uniref:hypothetical protein n=1 Tax=Solwaraspora sp. WMMD792 TaxID=3016099 RepID=UPI002415C2A5|nr:hypothetical protein [Solwaraspora sp. WMMD792]MDG4773009.1 hypothetical protein [Solwaraspora sp. WMMD792]
MQLEAVLMFALPDEIEDILQAIRRLGDRESVPIALAGLAVIISAWAALISRRSMKASERGAIAAEIQARHATVQADAAERQAVAASEQAYLASSEVHTAIQSSQISALEGAKARIDASLPRVSVIIFKKNDHAGLSENSYALAAPLHVMADTVPVQLDHWSTEGSESSTPHWAWDAFFVSHGLLLNFGNEPARVIPNGVQFYAATHPFTGEKLEEPPTTIHGERILYPGQSALFQVIARKQVDDWVRIIRKNETGKEYCEAYISFFPADFDEPECAVRIRTTGNPLRRPIPKNTYAIFVPNSYFDVRLEFLRNYPDSPEEIAARLKGDKEELLALQLQKDRTRMLHEELAARKSDAKGKNTNAGNTSAD